MVIKMEVVKKVVGEGVKPVIADGGKCLATGVAYGMMVGLGLEGYKVGKKIVAEAAKGVRKAVTNLKAKKAKPEQPTQEQPIQDNPEENTQIQG